VSTTVLPENGPASGSAGPVSSPETPCARSRATSEAFDGRSNQLRIAAAVFGPISGTAVSAPGSAAASASIVRNRRASSRAAFSPTCRMPSAKSRR